MDKMDEYREKLNLLNKEYGVDIYPADRSEYSSDARFDVYLQKHFNGELVSINGEWSCIREDGVSVVKRFK